MNIQNKQEILPPIWIGRIFLIVALSIFAVYGYFTFKKVQARMWPTVACKIITSNAHSIDWHYELEVEYLYKANGDELRGKNLNSVNSTKYIIPSIKNRLPLLHKYAPESEHLCHINPKNPKEAVLIVAPFISGNWYLHLIPLFLMALFAFGGTKIYAMHAHLTDFSTIKKPKFNGYSNLILASIFIGLGLLGIVKYITSICIKPDLSTTNGTVLFSEIKSFSKDIRKYSPQITYTYTVDGIIYENDDFLDHNFRGIIFENCVAYNLDSAKELVHNFSRLKPIQVLYDRKNPQRSMLAKMPPLSRFDISICSFLLFFIAVGTTILLNYSRMTPYPPKGNWRTYDNTKLSRILDDKMLDIIYFSATFAPFSLGLATIIPWEITSLPSKIILGIVIGIFSICSLHSMCELIQKLFFHLTRPHYNVKITASPLKPGATINMSYSINHKINRLRIIIVQHDLSRNNHTMANKSNVAAPHNYIVSIQNNKDATSGTITFTMPEPFILNGTPKYQPIKWQIKFAYKYKSKSCFDLFHISM